MRGHIDLSGHKLANVYRAPTQRQRWKRYRPPPNKGDEAYKQLVRVIDGAVRDCFATHPEYLTVTGRRHAYASVVKRVSGALWGYGKQVSFAAEAARGRSADSVDASKKVAAKQETVALGSTSPTIRREITPDQTTPLLGGVVSGGDGTFVPADNLGLPQLELWFTETFGVGLWRMRNGRIAKITKKLALDCMGPDGTFIYEVWTGHCLCCHANFTWQLDGCYAAVGTHEFDLVGKP